MSCRRRFDDGGRVGWSGAVVAEKKVFKAATALNDFDEFADRRDPLPLIPAKARTQTRFVNEAK